MPKLTVIKAIQKSFILWNIKNYEQIPIYYKWKINNKQIDNPAIVVDYNKKIKEWYIYYFVNETVYSCTIDDITGSTSINIT